MFFAGGFESDQPPRWRFWFWAGWAALLSGLEDFLGLLDQAIPARDALRGVGQLLGLALFDLCLQHRPRRPQH